MQEAIESLEGRIDITEAEIISTFELRGQQTMYSTNIEHYFERVLDSIYYIVSDHWHWHWRNDYATSS